MFSWRISGPLRNVLGIWVEETDALHKNEYNEVEIAIEGLEQSSYKVIDLCDLIHLETAKAIGKYSTDFYKENAGIDSESIWRRGGHITSHLEIIMIFEEKFFTPI